MTRKNKVINEIQKQRRIQKKVSVGDKMKLVAENKRARFEYDLKSLVVNHQ